MKSYKHENAPGVRKMIENVKFIDYAMYTKFRKMLIMGENFE